MSINPELLKKITFDSSIKTTGMEGLISSIHKAPRLREWVTLESRALAPIPFKKGNNWYIMTLLVIPKKFEDDTQISNQLNHPWGAIEWILPQEVVTQTIDLRWNEAISQLNKEQIIQPFKTDINLDTKNKKQRERILFQLLDKLIIESFDLTNLAPHYIELLPREIYPYYWELIPECKTWLNPDVSAVVLPKQTSAIVTQAQKINQDLLLPENLTNYIQQWLNQLKNITEYSNLLDNLSEIRQQIQRLEYQHVLPEFRLAIVGEFSRGKSNLINCILGQEILPVGSLPTTSTLISIFPHPDNQMEIYLPNKPVEIRPLSIESWDNLLATDPTGNNQEILAKIRLKLDNSWLQKINVELVDTPGAGDLSSQRSALIFDLLSQCDAAVLVISATIPLSLTEIAFLEQEIIGRHIPHILVVVSKLDTVRKEERQSVFDSIIYRLNQVYPNIPVLPLHPINDSFSKIDTLENIKNQLEQMVAEGERKIWRSRQIAHQLVDYCQQLKIVAETAIYTAKLDQFTREKAIEENQKLIQNTEIYWQHIQIELDKKRIQNYQQLEQRFSEFKEGLLDILVFELKKTLNPKSWWEEDLPFKLRKELLTLSRNSETFIIQKIAQDISWLQEKVIEYFSQQINPILPGNTQQLDIDYGINNLSLTDLQQYRLFTRLGSSAAMIGGYILGGPIGIIASTGVWLLGENMMNKTVEEQKALISQELETKLNYSLNQYCQKVSERLRQTYQQISQQIQQEEIIWKQNQQILVKNIDSTQEVEKWTTLINQVNDLENSITNALNI